MQADGSAEQAVVHYAVARRYLTEAQVAAARARRAPGSALLPLLAAHLGPQQRNELMVIYNLQLQAGGAGSGVVKVSGSGAWGLASGAVQQATVAVPMQMPKPASQQAPQMIDRYRIVKELARGGMGVVYIGHDAGLDRHVAIKLMLHTSNRVEVEPRVDCRRRL